MAMDGAAFSLILPSDLRMLSIARSFIEAACEAYRLNRTMTNALMIVTGEAITNIVRHAHQNRSDTQIEIHLHIRETEVAMIFADEGDPFDLDAVPELPPGDLRIGGRGIYLMRTLMDELTCQPRGDGRSGNVLRMSKRLDGAMRACG